MGGRLDNGSGPATQSVKEFEAVYVWETRPANSAILRRVFSRQGQDFAAISGVQLSRMKVSNQSLYPGPMLDVPTGVMAFPILAGDFWASRISSAFGPASRSGLEEICVMGMRSSTAMAEDVAVIHGERVSGEWDLPGRGVGRMGRMGT